MFISWHDIGTWAIGVLATTTGNLISLAIVTSVTQTHWFKNFLAKFTEDIDNIKATRYIKKIKEDN